MSDLIFHVYQKGSNNVRLHSLSVDELEDALRSEKIKLGEVEIETLVQEKTEEASY